MTATELLLLPTLGAALDTPVTIQGTRLVLAARTGVFLSTTAAAVLDAAVALTGVTAACGILDRRILFLLGHADSSIADGVSLLSPLLLLLLMLLLMLILLSRARHVPVAVDSDWTAVGNLRAGGDDSAADWADNPSATATAVDDGSTRHSTAGPSLLITTNDKHFKY